MRPCISSLGEHSSSTCVQVTALSSGESKVYGVLRGSACAIHVRRLLLEMDVKMELEALTDSSEARGMVRRSGSGRVKHLEARWLWLQERTRAKELHVGMVDTTRSSADLGTKFRPRRRFDVLRMRFPLGIGVGLMTSPGAEVDRAERGNGDASLTTIFRSKKWIFCGVAREEVPDFDFLLKPVDCWCSWRRFPSSVCARRKRCVAFFLR